MADTKVLPKDGPSEGCDWPIGRVLPKDDPSEGCDWTRRKMVRLKFSPKESDWTKEEYFPYDDASDLSSCQTDLIGRERKLVRMTMRPTCLLGRF